MNADFDPDKFLRPVASGIRDALFDAFEAGRVVGKREAAAEMKAKLAAALDFDASSLSAKQTIEREQPATSETSNPIVDSVPPRLSRAPRGSVKPAVMGMLTGILGATQAEIVNHTGINENSVRGILNTLRNDGLAYKKGEVWSLTIKGELQVAAETDPPNSTEQNTEDAEKETGQVPSASSEKSITEVIDWN